MPSLRSAAGYAGGRECRRLVACVFRRFVVVYVAEPPVCVERVPAHRFWKTCVWIRPSASTMAATLHAVWRIRRILLCPQTNGQKQSSVHFEGFAYIGVRTVYVVHHALNHKRKRVKSISDRIPCIFTTWEADVKRLIQIRRGKCMI